MDTIQNMIVITELKKMGSIIPYKTHTTESTETIQQTPYNRHHTTETIQQTPYNRDHTTDTIYTNIHVNSHIGGSKINSYSVSRDN